MSRIFENAHAPRGVIGVQIRRKCETCGKLLSRADTLQNHT